MRWNVHNAQLQGNDDNQLLGSSIYHETCSYYQIDSTQLHLSVTVGGEPEVFPTLDIKTYMCMYT